MKQNINAQWQPNVGHDYMGWRANAYVARDAKVHAALFAIWTWHSGPS
jgi:hypothetical protein